MEERKFFVDFFAHGKNIKVFHFSNGDMQFLFDDGFCLIFHSKEYYVSCDDK